MQFVVQLYKCQIRNKRFFLHEHPATATSWQLDAIKQLARTEGVSVSRADLCMYGMRTWDESGKEAYAKKPTKFMTNSRSIAHELNMKCDRTHVHQPLTGGRASQAARYPEQLCRAICRAILREKRQNTMQLKALVEVRPTLSSLAAGQGSVRRHTPDPQEFHEKEEARILSQGLAWDDLTNMQLDAGKVMEARKKEIEYVRSRGVWEVENMQLAMVGRL